jgi:hypothetical protein
MLTKVGRTHPMLICTDCGLPVDQREAASLSRQRLVAASSLLVMALVGGALLSLASLNEARREGAETIQREEAAEAQGENSPLLEPSALVDRHVGPGERALETRATPTHPGD